MFEGFLQPLHLILVLAIALVVFGPGKLPDVGRSLGEAVRGFRKALKEIESPTAANASEGQGPAAEKRQE